MHGRFGFQVVDKKRKKREKEKKIRSEGGERRGETEVFPPCRGRYSEGGIIHSEREITREGKRETRALWKDLRRFCSSLMVGFCLLTLLVQPSKFG